MTAPLDPELTGRVAAGPAVATRPRRRARRRVLLIAFTVIGLVGVGGGGAGLARELTRTATPAEAAAAVRQEVATRWQRLTAGTVFPARVPFQDLLAGDYSATTARLVGIAPPASCRTALEPAAYRLIRTFGCATVLRATYVDAAGTAGATVGVAVLRSPAGALAARLALVGLPPGSGMHAVSYSGTLAGAFGDAARGAFGTESGGPYVFLYSAGYTDGMSGASASNDPDELNSLGSGVITAIKHVLTAHGSPCAMRDIQC